MANNIGVVVGGIGGLAGVTNAWHDAQQGDFNAQKSLISSVGSLGSTALGMSKIPGIAALAGPVGIKSAVDGFFADRESFLIASDVGDVNKQISGALGMAANITALLAAQVQTYVAMPLLTFVPTRGIGLPNEGSVLALSAVSTGLSVIKLAWDKDFPFIHTVAELDPVYAEWMKQSVQSKHVTLVGDPIASENISGFAAGIFSMNVGNGKFQLTMPQEFAGSDILSTELSYYKSGKSSIIQTRSDDSYVSESISTFTKKAKISTKENIFQDGASVTEKFQKEGSRKISQKDSHGNLVAESDIGTDGRSKLTLYDPRNHKKIYSENYDSGGETDPDSIFFDFKVDQNAALAAITNVVLTRILAKTLSVDGIGAQYALAAMQRTSVEAISSAIFLGQKLDMSAVLANVGYGIIGLGTGAVGAQLGHDIDEALGLPLPVGSTVLGISSGVAGVVLAKYAVANLEAALLSTHGISLAEQWAVANGGAGVVTQLGLAGGSLAAGVVESWIGLDSPNAQLGGSLAAAANAAYLAIAAPQIGVPLLIAEAIGAHFLGALFGSLFGHSGVGPTAVAHFGWDEQAQRFVFLAAEQSKGGPIGAATTLAQNIVDVLNTFLTEMGAHVVGGATTESVMYIAGAWRHAWGSVAPQAGYPSYGTAGDTAEHVVIATLKALSLRGDAIVNFVMLTSEASTVEALAEEVSAAQAFSAYLRDPVGVVLAEASLATAEQYAAWQRMMQFAQDRYFDRLSLEGSTLVVNSSAGSFATDVAALGQMPGQAYHTNWSGTSAEVSEGLSMLGAQAAAGHLISVTVSGVPALTVGYADWIANSQVLAMIGNLQSVAIRDVPVSAVAQTILVPHVTSVAIRDTAANVFADLDQLQAAGDKVSSVALTTTETRTLTAAQFDAYTPALAKIEGSFELIVTDVEITDAARIAQNEHVAGVHVEGSARDLQGNLSTLDALSGARKLEHVTTTDLNPIEINIGEYKGYSAVFSNLEGNLKIREEGHLDTLTVKSTTASVDIHMSGHIIFEDWHHEFCTVHVGIHDSLRIDGFTWGYHKIDIDLEGSGMGEIAITPKDYWHGSWYSAEIHQKMDNQFYGIFVTGGYFGSAVNEHMHLEGNHLWIY